MGVLGRYKNGNYNVTLFEDGTKVRYTNEDEFRPSFPENIDCKITNRCDGGCTFCYEGCTSTGEHADLTKWEFLDTLRPFTELAINGNDLTHPQLKEFLILMNDRKVVVNMTVNQKHFEMHHDKIVEFIEAGLIKGLGVSVSTNITPRVIEMLKGYPNAVVHVIAGLFNSAMLDVLRNNNLKILILGYKSIGRGSKYYKDNQVNIQENIKWLKNNLSIVVDCFKVVSFDNLAIDQLALRNLRLVEDWDRFYMGDDGRYTFYVDLVAGVFAKNSVAPATERYSILDTVDSMFLQVQHS